MAPIGKLYTYPNNPRAAKALIAARYNGVELELPNFQMGVTNKTPEFLEKFPFGKVPALETADGAYIYESNAIQFYVAESKKDTQLLGKTPVERALVQTFVNIAINEITPAASTWIFPLLGIVPHSQQNEDKAKISTVPSKPWIMFFWTRHTWLVNLSLLLTSTWPWLFSTYSAWFWTHQPALIM